VRDDPRIGVVLDDRYVLAERLGAGGMGVVYKAKHRYTGELVAVKLLPVDWAGATTQDAILERFLQEPHLQRLARHPNVVRVLDAGMADGQPYLVTEYIDGEDLQQRLEGRGALHIPETLTILNQAAAALDAAHEQGVIHRDVKPGNVLVRSDGRVFLADFGVAADPSDRGGTAIFMGTVAYAAPEQITLEDVADGRADVYSLGCVLFHCLVGRPPFEAGSPYELMRKHVSQPPPAVSADGRNLPEGLDRVIARALAKRRQDRYSTCAALIADAALVTGTDLASLDATNSETTWTPSSTRVAPHPTYAYTTPPLIQPDGTVPAAAASRRGWVVTAIAGVAVALVAGMLAAYLLARPDGHTAADSGTAAGPARHHTSSSPRTGASEFSGYAATLENDFPAQISSHSCGVEPDDADPGALVQIRCHTDNGRVNAYYELWPSQAAMSQLLDANSGGLNVYFAGTWTDNSGTPRGRIDRFFTGLFRPQNVILWSYRTLNATIWAQSTLSAEQLLAWWRSSAPTPTSGQTA
jgi:serine/threonine-protein kinase